MSAQCDSHRDYLESHPWITFTFHLDRLAPIDWINIGESWSKCDHIAGVPLQPAVAEELHHVYLAKGVHATTQIEGNTLSEDEVGQRVRGTLELPESQEYLGTEVDNILRACQLIAKDMATGQDMQLTPERIKHFNRMVLQGLPLEDHVSPGEVRTQSVVVGDYRGVPSQDCEFLLESLCRWLSDLIEVEEPWLRPMKLLRAMLAHLYLAWIHPFGDGNGRTARLVEFQLLADAGFPSPACQLLSNYYNRTRQRYYRVLAETSRDPYPVEKFVSYALRGFVEELREQLKVIRVQQIRVLWINLVHERFSGQESRTAQRRRNLILALSPGVFTPVRDLRRLTPELAEAYAGKQQKTVSRDVNEIVKTGLVERDRSGVRPRIELLSGFLPLRQTA